MADSTGEGPSKDAPVPPKKRSLFGNPAWSKPQESKEAIEFFSRAKELYPMRVAEEERKMQKKLAKQKQERKRSTASAERRASSTPELKRQRLSSEAQDGGHNSSDDSPNKQLLDDVFSSHGKPPPSPSPAHYPTRTRSPASPTGWSARNVTTLPDQREVKGKQKLIPNNIILLSDDEDARPSTRNTRRTRSTAAQPITLDDDVGDIYPVLPVIPHDGEEDPQLSDEEFPELVQRARERAKQKELDRLNAAKAFGEQNHKPSTPVVDDIFQDSDILEADPVVEILVTSWLEGTNPLLVRRKLNQRLKEVRLSWCDKQAIQGTSLPPQLRASIFLTWNGKRLFDASTCKHLGIKMGRDGRFSSDGDGFDDHGRLHFEAWTEELFVAYQSSTQQQNGGEDQENTEENQEQSGRVKLLLQARDMEPFRMRVKPTTSVQKICQAFRNEKNVPTDKDIALFFDGDKLDPEMSVEDAELADMDTVEVHIR